MVSVSQINYRSIGINSTIMLSQSEMTLVNISILFRGITMNQTATFFDQNGSQLFSIDAISGVTTIAWSNAPLGSITVSDPTYTGYEVDAVWQFNTAASAAELTQLQASSIFSFTPIFQSGLANLYSYSNLTLSTNQTYANLSVFNDSTLTLNSGANIVVTGNLYVDTGSSLVLNDAVLTVQGTSTILGSMTSDNSLDSITLLDTSLYSGELSLAGSLNLITPGVLYTYSNDALVNTGTITIAGTFSITPATFTLSGTGGTISVSFGGQLELSSGTITLSSTNTISGAGTLSWSNSPIISINGNTTINASTSSLVGTITIGTGKTLTYAPSSTSTFSASVSGGTIVCSGTGTLSVPTGLVNVSSAISGWTCPINVTGTLCLSSGTSQATSSTNLLGSPTIGAISGTGFVVASASSGGTGTTSVSLAAVSVSAGTTGGGSYNVIATGKIPYFALTSLAGSAAGTYSFGNKNNNTTTYQIYIFFYTGSTSPTTLLTGINLSGSSADINADTLVIYNVTNSAGSITVSGKNFA